MKVHFITSRLSIVDDINSIRVVADAMKKVGYEYEDWLNEAFEREQEDKRNEADWSSIFKKNMENIAKADVVIAETSNASFAVGYQVAVAVQQKKPVLLLRHNDTDINAFISGVEDGWVKHVRYDKDTIENILQKFYAENDIQSKDMRFNFFIDRKIYNYLRWAAFKTGKTKAEILRDLVETEIEKQEYQP
jgi:hypothetical protein